MLSEQNDKVKVFEKYLIILLMKQSQQPLNTISVWRNEESLKLFREYYHLGIYTQEEGWTYTVAKQF